MSDVRVLSYPAHTRAVLLLGLPLIGGHLAQFAISLTDTAMLGWYGAEALAAVTLGGTYFFVMFIFGSGFAWAVMPMVAEADAQDDQVQIRRITRMGIWLSLLFSAIAIPFFWFSAEVLAALGQNETVSRTASSYLRVAGWGLPPPFWSWF